MEKQKAMKTFLTTANYTCIVKTEEIDSLAALHAARSFLDGQAGTAHTLVNRLMRMPVYPVFNTETKVQAEIIRHRRHGHPAALAEIAMGLDKDFSGYRAQLGEQQINISSICEALEQDLVQVAGAQTMYVAAKIEALEVQHLQTQVEAAQAIVPTGRGADGAENSLQAERDAKEDLLRQCQAIDQQTRFALQSTKSGIARFQWLVAAIAAFLCISALTALFIPGQPLWVLGLSALGGLVGGWVYADRPGDLSPQAFAAYDALSRPGRERLIRYYENLARKELTIREGATAEQVLANWATRGFARRLRQCLPSDQLRECESSYSLYGPLYFHELDPGQVIFLGRRLAEILVAFREPDQGDFLRRVGERLAQSTQDRIRQITGEELFRALRSACLQEMLGPFSLLEVVEAMMRDPSAQSLLRSQIGMIAAAAGDIFRHSEASRLDSNRKAGNVQIGFPVFPPPRQIEELVNGAISPKPRYYRAANPGAIEAFFAVLNVPAEHSQEHQFGAEALDQIGDKGQVDRLWRYPKGLRHPEPGEGQAPPAQ